MFIPIHDDNPLRSIRHPWATYALISLNVLVYIAELLAVGQTMIISFAVIPVELLRGGVAGGAITGGAITGTLEQWPVPEVVTLVSYLFFHADPMHLATNMAFLWVFGDNVEDAMGHTRFVAFYLACGAAGGLAHTAALPASNLPLIGASAAVAGVIAAYVMLHPKVQVWLLALRIIPLRLSAGVALGLWIATQFIMVFVRDGGETAWWAHVGGIVAGAVLIVGLRKPGYPLFDRRVRDTLAARRPEV